MEHTSFRAAPHTARNEACHSNAVFRADAPHLLSVWTQLTPPPVVVSAPRVRPLSLPRDRETSALTPHQAAFDSSTCQRQGRPETRKPQYIPLSP